MYFFKKNNIYIFISLIILFFFNKILILNSYSTISSNININNNLYSKIKSKPQKIKSKPQKITTFKQKKIIPNSILNNKNIFSDLFYKNKNIIKTHTPITIIIDAGHGGKDPGAIGKNGNLEKNITINIARKLNKYLSIDPMFKPIMTRNNDNYISINKRLEIARKNIANILISIHADAALNNKARGASAWIISNKRANNELGNWLEKHEKQSELLGGAGNVLAKILDPNLSQAVLDLQFEYSQNIGYTIASTILQELNKIGKIHKHNPEHASLGILSSPDIPSILIETSFLTNIFEEYLLTSDQYQKKIANAIYKGLHNYFLKYPLQIKPQ